MDRLGMVTGQRCQASLRVSLRVGFNIRRISRLFAIMLGLAENPGIVIGNSVRIREDNRRYFSFNCVSILA